jgi:hypothetical protein
MKKSLILAFVLALLPQVSASAATNPYGGSAIDPAAPNEVILTVSSPTAMKAYKANELFAMAKNTVTIHEPFVKKNQNFAVIPLATLFSQAKISPRQSVETRALNDYIYTNVAASFIAAKGYLAVKLNGAPIPYDQGGPIRIIFPNSRIWAKFLDPWNWSLNSITAK